MPWPRTKTYYPQTISRCRSLARNAGQVFRIDASGVNPLDLKIHSGDAAHARQPLPTILGIDLAGVVEAAGPGVTGFRGGDEVYGMTGGVGGLQGSLAEFAAVDANLLAPKPATLSMREAAALPVAFITPWEGLVDRAAIKPGQKVLIQHLACEFRGEPRGAGLYGGHERRREGDSIP